MGYPVHATFAANANTGNFKNIGTELATRGTRSMTFTGGSTVDFVCVPPTGTNTAAGADAEHAAGRYFQIRAATNSGAPPVLPPMDITRCWVRSNSASGVTTSILAWG